MRKRFNLDIASTTPVRSAVVSVMKSYWSLNFGNPSAITKEGVSARRALETARALVAKTLDRQPGEIIFTSGGTESNNLAIWGVVNDLEKEGMTISAMHFITTNIEHSSVLKCFTELERRGARVDYLAVAENGLINLKDLRKALKLNTVLVSIGYANNEIGVIQPLSKIAKEIRHARKNKSLPYFHTDASQAALFLDLNINRLGVDLLTLDAQKIFGPKGVGALFVKAGIKLSPLIFGGEQEKGWRAGTENVPLIVGLAKALELARRSWLKNSKKVKIVRDYFWLKIRKEIPEVILNGAEAERLPNNLNISFLGIDPAFTVLCLDEVGIICSTKSACEREADESFVIRALGVPDAVVKSALRFSLDLNIGKKDIDKIVRELKIIVSKQREKSKLAFL